MRSRPRETRTDLVKGNFAPTPTNRRILNNFHLKRSGHIHIISDQFWYFYYEMDTTTHIADIHCSPWTYDTHVPIIFAGHGLPGRTVSRRVGPRDIAPTIAAYLGIKPPSGAVGNPLAEVVEP